MEVYVVTAETEAHGRFIVGVFSDPVVANAQESRIAAEIGPFNDGEYIPHNFCVTTIQLDKIYV